MNNRFGYATGAMRLTALLVILLTSTCVHAQEIGGIEFVRSNKMVATKVVPLPDGMLPTPGGVFGKAGRNVGMNVVVNAPQAALPNGLLGRSETIIASDPSGNFLVAGWNDAEGFCGAPFGAPCPAPAVPGFSGFGWSTDGGHVWIDGGTPPTHAQGGDTWMTRGDPWLSTGGPGSKTFYYANMAIPVVDNSAYGRTGLLVHRGKFTGNSFSFTNSTLIPPTKPNGADTYDKEALSAGKTGNTKNTVALSVTNFIEVNSVPQDGYGQIEVYTSFNQASTFANFGIVQADESATATVNQGSAVAVGPGGEIYVAWERGWLFPLTGSPVTPQIVFSKSVDGGLTFSPRTVVSDISSAALFPPPGYNRPTTNDFPRMAVATGGDDPYLGRIYVAYADSRIANGGPQSVTGGFGNGDTDVYLRFSSDNGNTWSAPTLIASGAPLQFWPAVDVQSDGTVDVVWYESSNGGMVDVYYAGSEDGGATFSAPVKVTAAPTNWTTAMSNMRPNFGDYIGIASTTNRTFACWGDASAFGYPSVYTAAIAYGTPKKPVDVGTTAVSMELAQNYPNPFNPSTAISYSITNPAFVTLKVYNVVGKEVASLVNSVQSAGTHSISFDASQLAGGMYVYRLTTGDESISKSMMLVK